MQTTKNQYSNSIQLKVKPTRGVPSYTRQKYIDTNQRENVLEHLDKVKHPPHTTEDAAKPFECHVLSCTFTMTLQAHGDMTDGHAHDCQQQTLSLFPGTIS